MIALLDINVLVALAWPNHVHHDLAHEWFDSQQKLGWATSPVTQTGFVRVSSNQRVVPEAKTPAEAILLLRRITALRGHTFWPDDIAIASSDAIALDRILGHRQVTDAHLVALALRHHGSLATFDRGVTSVVPPSTERPDVVMVIT